MMTHISSVLYRSTLHMYLDFGMLHSGVTTGDLTDVAGYLPIFIYTGGLVALAVQQ